MPDLTEVTFAQPYHLPLLLLGCAVIVIGALIPVRRHAARTRWIAAGVRLLALLALGVVMLGPVVTVQAESRFEPQGTWRLALPGGASLPGDYSEPPGEFVQRVRDALVEGNPPARVAVSGPDRNSTIPVRDRLSALGVPAEAIFPAAASSVPQPVLTGIDAPIAVKPGEAFVARFAQAGPTATLRVTLDGKELEAVDGRYEVRTDVRGRHVLEGVLLDAQGNELQRSGHVFRVGEHPRALAIGLTLVLAHLIFVLPYVFLSLSDPWRAMDHRYEAVAAGLGKRRWRTLLSIRLPMLARPILTAAAVGFAVSVGQYLPTLLIGAGRLPTITTEAVALASGGARRTIGVYALLQMLLPAIGFAIAVFLPALLFRHRRAMQA